MLEKTRQRIAMGIVEMPGFWCRRHEGSCAQN
jgi:hypothetical protein